MFSSLSSYLVSGFYPNLDLILFANRVVVGLFFAIAGYHKIFNEDRRAHLVETLERDGIPMVRFNSWWVPLVECLGGIALCFGFISIIASALLLVICLVATCFDGLRSIKATYKILDKADYLDDLLYLPESLYTVMLAVIIVMGPGKWSVDAIILS